MVTCNRYLGGFSPFAGVDDPRDPDRITYPLDALAFAGLLLFLAQLTARRRLRVQLGGNPAVRRTFQALFDLPDAAFPHGDTLNDAFAQLSVAQVQEALCSAVERLIRAKVLDSFRLLDHFFVVAVDATGVLTYDRRHCPHCLTRKHSSGATEYYHPVLEAKLVCRNGFAFSIMTEFIANPGENPDKQDCELKAFYRLAPRLKKRFPRLPILLTMDGLYAVGPVFDICDHNGWGFMAVLKDGCLKSVHEEWDALRPLQPDNRLARNCGDDGAVHQEFRWVNGILYTDDAQREHTLHVLECRETKPGEGGQPLASRHLWVTNQRITRGNVVRLAEDGGRSRWKIENEGFNVQKNRGYALEHAYSRNETAAQVFYLLAQLAHLVQQLWTKGSLLRRLLPKGFLASRDLAFWLLEALRALAVSAERLAAWLAGRVQFRFDSS